MQKQSNCGQCAWLEEIPFAGFVCQNDSSDFCTCECDPKRDYCEYFKEKK